MHEHKPAVRAWIAVLALAVAGCGATEPETELFQPEGIWRSTSPGREISLRLSSDRSVERVDADRTGQRCETGRGTWALSAGLLVVDITEVNGGPAALQERYQPEAGGIRRVAGPPSGADDGVLARVALMKTCPDYGWGAWSGTLSASIDGVARSFSNLRVDVGVDGGRLRIESLTRTCATCPIDTSELVVALDASSGALVAGTYVVDNSAGAERSLYGFFHPDPGNPTFGGFSTERLSPPGQFVLAEIGSDRVVGAFEFRGNPVADGQVAPDGSTFTLVTAGVVDLEYR